MSDSNPPQEIRPKPSPGGVLYSYQYLTKCFVAVSFAFLLSFVFNGVFMFMLKSQWERKPWVVTVGADGNMTDLFMKEFTTTPDLVYQYVGFVIPRLYFVNLDKQPGIEDLKKLVDERILRKEMADFQVSSAHSAVNEVVMQAQPTRLLVGTPGNRAFCISERYKRVYCMVEGRFTMTSKKQNYSDPIRWDVELEILAPTTGNRWGLRLVQIHERPLDAPNLEIPQLYFEK